MMPRDMQSDAHARANAEQLRLLLEALELAACPPRPGSIAAMRPENPTPSEIAKQLARMCQANQGLSDNLPSAKERTALANYLGCHKEVRAAAWAAWSVELTTAERDAAEYWLDLEFIGSCPEHQS